MVVNTPVVAPPFAAPPPAAPQLPDPKALRTVSQRPDETQIATATPSATDSGDAVQARDGPQPPAKPATKGASEAAGVAQPPTHKLDLPTKLSRKPSARIVVAKTETAAPGPEADKAPETPIEPQAASAVPLVPAPKPVDPLSHAFSYIVGALGVTTASAPRPAVRGVTSEESPIELGDHASLGNAPPAANLTPTSPGEVQSTVGASPGPPGSVVVNTPVVAPPFAAPPPAAPQFHDPKALRTVSQRPDETQIATATPSATDSGDAVQARDGPQPPAKPATKGASEAAGVAQPPTHKLDLPTKLSRKPSARIVVAKTETAAPGPEADKAPETPIEPQAASAVPLVPAPKPVDPLSHAFSYIVGGLGVTTASAPRPAVRGVTSEESPIELGDHASLGNAPPAANLTPTSPGEVQSTVGASPGPPGSVVVNTPVVAPPFAAPPPAAPQFHDPKAKPSAPIVVAKTETVAPGPGAEKAPETPRAQQPVSPLSHAFSYVVSALGVPAASAPKPVDQTAAHKSGDWAIQFAAKKSEAEAKVNVARFNAKYAAALNGATIGVNKTVVNGETIYALRVTGLSKAEAAALCERLKGRDCFIAK